ncbi:MAG: T9SS type A sorting domain-containing protein [Chitinophagaceae bacterium]|nr:T9SS type A sorting domain-containing protein [Chitinophagaceae bacterium]
MTGGPFNVIRTNGTAYGGGPDNARNGTQYIDVTSAAGTVFQNFTISGSSTSISFGGYFSSREQAGYVNWTASINIVSLPSLTVVATSSTRAFTVSDGASPAQENWYYLFGNVTLPAGNYRFVANIGNYGNFDAAFVFANCTLPILLTSFSGDYKNNAVNLMWTAEQNIDFSHFEIERSDDAVIFKQIGRVDLSTANQYSFRDNNILTGSRYYYRLKMIDLNGKSAYSSLLRIQTGGFARLSINPNPVTNRLNIAGLKSKGIIRITDASGRMMLSRVVQAQAMFVDVSHLNKGIYLLQYFDGTETTVQQFLKN